MKSIPVCVAAIVAFVLSLSGVGCGSQPPNADSASRSKGNLSQEKEPSPLPSSNTAQSTLPKAPPDPHQAKRRQVMKKVLASVDAVLKRTDDVEARRVGELLHRGYILSAPLIYEGQLAASPTTVRGDRLENEPWVLLVPVLKEDPEPWRKVYGTHRSVASYIPEVNAIGLGDPDQFSLLWLGVLALHEGLHWARFTAFGPPPPDSELDHFLEEVEAYSMEMRVLDDVGGQPYQKLVARVRDQLAPGIILERNARGSITIRATGTQQGYDRDLGSIFGPPKSETERLMRATVLTIQAVFAVIDQRNLPLEESHTLKAHYLSAVDPER